MSAESGDESSLQFDTMQPAGAPAAAGATPAAVSCAICDRALADQYFEAGGQPVCEACRTQLELLSATPRSWGTFARSALFGLGAAAAGAILYFAVVAITGFEIGIVAIAIGYMVGWAVRRGARGRGGRRFQVLALALTYWAVGLAYVPLAVREVLNRAGSETTHASEEAAPSGAEAPRPAPDGAAAPSTAGSATDSSPETDQRLGLPLFLALATGFTLILPVMIVVASLPGGLISGAIIAFGMQQAWRMTGAPKIDVTGPYRLATLPTRHSHPDFQHG